MKVFSINPTTQTIKNTLVNVCKKSKNIIKTNNAEELLPIVSTPLITYVIMSENDAKKKFWKDILDNKYIMPKNKDNMRHVEELEDLKIIEPQKAWDSPRFDDYSLTDTHYNKIVDAIKNSKTLTSREKEAHLKRLAENNYKTYNTTFRGHDETKIDSYTTENSDTDIDPEIKDEISDVLAYDKPLCPELQAIHDAPDIVDTDEMMQELFGELAEQLELDTDWDTGEVLKAMGDELTNIENFIS